MYAGWCTEVVIIAAAVVVVSAAVLISIPITSSISGSHGSSPHDFAGGIFQGGLQGLHIVMQQLVAVPAVVGIEQRDIGGAGFGNARVARPGEAAIGLRDDADTRIGKGAGQGDGTVRSAIVDHDQFEVFEGLMEEYDQTALSEIVVKPHPREDMAAWEHVVQGRAQLSLTSAADLLTACDGVIGMTSMVLIEAHLLGLPVLSLQPGRTGNANPLVEDATLPVLAWSAFPDAWQAYHELLGTEQTISTRFNGLLRDADQRLVDAVEATVETNERELKC